MNYVSQSEFAKLAGISRQAVYDAIKRGAIIIKVQGKKKRIDLDDPANTSYLEDYSNGQRKIKQKKPVQKKAVKPKKNNKKSEKKEVFTGKVILPNDGGYEQAALDLSGFSDEDLSNLTKHDLDRMKLKVVIEKERVRKDKERGDLIERDLIKRVFGELYNIDRNEFLQLSAKLTGKICSSIFKTNDIKILKKVNKAIDDEMYKTLEHIRLTLNKVLIEIKAEEIKNDIA